MMMVDNVVALLRPQHDRNHVVANERADLLRFLLSQAFAFFLDLAHAYSDLGGTQAFRSDRLQNRLAHVSHRVPPRNSKLGLKSSSVFPFAPVNRTMFVDRKGGSEMRAALARPRRHRGTENATIALRDSVLATKLLATASIRRRSTHPLIFGAVIFGVG